MTGKMLFGIEIGQRYEQSHQSERRDIDIDEISAYDRSEDIGQIRYSRDIAVDGSDIGPIAEHHVLEDRTEDALEESTHRDKPDDRQQSMEEECSEIADGHSQQADADKLLVGESLEPERSQQQSLIDDHDESEHRHDISADLAAYAEMLAQIEGERHLIDHDGEIDDQEDEIISLFVGDEHILEDADDIHAHFLGLIQELVGLRDSSEDECKIEER